MRQISLPLVYGAGTVLKGYFIRRYRPRVVTQTP